MNKHPTKTPVEGSEKTLELLDDSFDVLADYFGSFVDRRIKDLADVEKGSSLRLRASSLLRDLHHMVGRLGGRRCPSALEAAHDAIDIVHQVTECFTKIQLVRIKGCVPQAVPGSAPPVPQAVPGSAPQFAGGAPQAVPAFASPLGGACPTKGRMSSAAVKTAPCRLGRPPTKVKSEAREEAATIRDLATEVAILIPPDRWPTRSWIYNCTFTSWDHRRETIEQAVAEFHGMVGRNAPKGTGVLLCLDRGITGRWHAHGFLFCSEPIHIEDKAGIKADTRSCNTIKQWWVRLPVWKRLGRRPGRKNQEIYRQTRSTLVARLVHHLGATRTGRSNKPNYRMLDLPPLSESVSASGCIEWTWCKAAIDLNIQGVNMPTNLVAPRSAEPIPKRTGVRPCRWCGESLQGRDDSAKTCNVKCRRKLSKRVAPYHKRLGKDIDGNDLDAWLERLMSGATGTGRYWLAHALRMAETAIESESAWELSDWRQLEWAVRCGCGAPLPHNGRLDASTCSNACRKRRARNRAARRPKPIEESTSSMKQAAASPRTPSVVARASQVPCPLPLEQ